MLLPESRLLLSRKSRNSGRSAENVGLIELHHSRRVDLLLSLDERATNAQTAPAMRGKRAPDLERATLGTTGARS